MRVADSIIVGLAGRQHGVVARWQLTAAGVPAHVVEYRVTRGRLEPLFRSVYRVAALAGRWQREMAAVLACGDSAVLSHRCGAVLLDLQPRDAGRGAVGVSVRSGHPRPRAGVRVYRVRLADDEVTVVDGVPVTTAARTLLDIACLVKPRALEQAFARALRRELATEDAVAEVLARYPRRPGAAALRQLLSLASPPALTRSPAEERFLGLVRRARLMEPRTNVPVEGFEVDFHWPAERLIVEIDGLAFHSSRQAMVRDRRRDAALSAAGFRVMRFTWADLTERPLHVLVLVAQALLRAGPA